MLQALGSIIIIIIIKVSSSSSPYMYLLMRRNATAAAAAQSRRAQTQTHFRRLSHLSPVVVWRKIAIQLQHVLGCCSRVTSPPPGCFSHVKQGGMKLVKTSSLKGGQRRKLHHRTWHSLTACCCTVHSFGRGSGYHRGTSTTSYMYLGGTVGYCRLSRRTERVRAWSLLTSLFGRCPHACWLHLR